MVGGVQHGHDDSLKTEQFEKGRGGQVQLAQLSLGSTQVGAVNKHNH